MWSAWALCLKLSPFYLLSEDNSVDFCAFLTRRDKCGLFTEQILSEGTINEEAFYSFTTTH